MRLLLAALLVALLPALAPRAAPLDALTLPASPSLPHEGPPQAPPALAFIKTQTTSPLLEDRAADFDALLLAALSARPDLVLVERAELAALLAELELDLAAATPADAARIGHWSGAGIVLSARAVAHPSGLVVATRVIGSETGRVIVLRTEIESPARLAPGAHELAQKIAALLAERRDELLPPPDDFAARQAALRSALRGRVPPPVLLFLAEQPASGPPADAPDSDALIAETFRHTWLAQGGQASLPEFPVAEALHFHLTAQAEPGLRRGELVSARASVSVRVIDPATGRELLRDRQAKITADYSPPLALESALRQASQALAARVLLRLSAPLP